MTDQKGHSTDNDAKKHFNPVGGDDAAKPVHPSDVANPRHREDFTSLLNEAVRKRESKD